MKKKILFMAINMNVGGTEKALLNMISEIPKEQYEITLLLLEKKGGFLEQVPREVKLKELEGYTNIRGLLNNPLKKSIIDRLRKRKIISALRLSFFYFQIKLLKEQRPFFDYLSRSIQVDKNQYDLAIAYAGPMDFISYYVLEKVSACQKIQWIHFDITKIVFNFTFARKIYQKFDRIFAVSNESKEKVIKKFPELNGKISPFLNIVSSELVLQLAEDGDGFSDNFDGTRILTVGRLSDEKGQDLAIRVMAKLKKEGLKVKWYCVGDGPARSKYEALIKELDLETDFILLGKKINPYPYMAQCDLYVQPSRHEGYCITLTEARCFNHPIVTTNFTGAQEQIKQQKTGLIVNDDEKEMFTAIITLLKDNKLYHRIRSNLEQESVSTIKELEKFYKLFTDRLSS